MFGHLFYQLVYYIQYFYRQSIAYCTKKSNVKQQKPTDILSRHLMYMMAKSFCSRAAVMGFHLGLDIETLEKHRVYPCSCESVALCYLLEFNRISKMEGHNIDTIIQHYSRIARLMGRPDLARSIESIDMGQCIPEYVI